MKNVKRGVMNSKKIKSNPHQTVNRKITKLLIDADAGKVKKKTFSNIDSAMKHRCKRLILFLFCVIARKAGSLTKQSITRWIAAPSLGLARNDGLILTQLNPKFRCLTSSSNY